MSSTRKFRDEKLPVTAEVGGEGGSYADPTYQEAAHDGVRGGGLDRVDQRDQQDAAGQIAHDALHRAEIEDGGVGTAPDPADGMKKPVTE